MKQFLIIIIYFSVGTVQAASLSSLSYGNKYNLNVSNTALSFMNGKNSYEILLNKCNTKYLKRVASSLKETKSKNIRLPSKNRKEITYKLNGYKKTTMFGSELHKVLENLPKKMIGYMSLMRKQCD